jgi:hypothetical protein
MYDGAIKRTEPLRRRLNKYFEINYCMEIFISYRPETRGIPQKITLRDEIFRGRSPRNI